jgi:hypothetical protein
MGFAIHGHKFNFTVNWRQILAAFQEPLGLKLLGFTIGQRDGNGGRGTWMTFILSALIFPQFQLMTLPVFSILTRSHSQTAQDCSSPREN